MLTGCLTLPFVILWWLVKIVILITALMFLLPIWLIVWVFALIFAFSNPITAAIIVVVAFLLGRD